LAKLKEKLFIAPNGIDTLRRDNRHLYEGLKLRIFIEVFEIFWPEYCALRLMFFVGKSLLSEFLVAGHNGDSILNGTFRKLLWLCRPPHLQLGAILATFFPIENQSRITTRLFRLCET
jgi:hypothetical protein